MRCRQKQYLRIDNYGKQRFYVITVCLFTGLSTVTFFVNVCFNYIVSYRFIWDTVLLYGLVVAFSLISGVLVLKDTKRDFKIMLFIFLILYLLSFLLFNDNRQYMFTTATDFSQNSFYRLFIYAMPLYFFLRQVTDYKLLFRYFSVTAKVIVISAIFTYMLYTFKGGFELQYMVFAYDALFGIFFCFYEYFQYRKLFSLLLAILGSIIIFIGGARGAFVCIVAYVLLYLIFNVRYHKRRTISFATLIAIIMVYISNNLMEVAVKVDVFFNGLGIHSRTIELILKNDFLNESGRDTIQSLLIEYISKNPFLGYGMFGDRPLTQGSFMGSQGTYAHNFIIEILTQYGVILGFIFLCIVFLIIGVGLLKKQDPIYKNLLLLFIPCGLIKLMMSGSYLNEMYFFLLLAAAVNSIKHKPKE